MRFHNLDLNLLVALDALLLEKNVTRAARRMNMSQTTMSGALGRLRQHFGDDLLVRNGRRMDLTLFAQGLRAPVQSILLQAETVALRRTAFDPATALGDFSIMALDAMHAVYSSKVCARIAREAPGISLSLMNFSSMRDATLFDSNEIQFLIAPSFSIGAHHPSIRLFDETMVCIASQKNDEIPRTLSLKAYLNARHILPRPHGSQGFESHDTTALRLLGHERKVGAMTTSYLTMPSLVASTPYLATVPRRLAIEAAKTLPLRILKLPFATPAVTEMLQWHRSFDGDPAIRWLRGVMQDVAARL